MTLRSRYCRLASLVLALSASLALRAADAPAAPAGAAPTAPAAAKPKMAPVGPYRLKFGKLKEGDMVPDFTATAPDGSTRSFSEYAKGKTVILDFWATWCGPCQEAMPRLDALAKRYADQGVIVVGVCCFDTREKFSAWVAGRGKAYSFTVLFDPTGLIEAKDKEGMKRTVIYKVTSVALQPVLPQTLVMTRDGKLAGSPTGSGEAAEKSLELLLQRAGITLAKDSKS